MAIRIEYRNLTSKVLLRDQRTQGTPGGDFTAGSWIPRILNTIVFDYDSLAELLSPTQFRLQPGFWECNIVCPAYQVQRHQARLRNVDLSDVVAWGSPQRANPGVFATNTSIIAEPFVIEVPTIFEVQHFCSSTRNGDGFGEAASHGPEHYTSAHFTRFGIV